MIKTNIAVLTNLTNYEINSVSGGGITKGYNLSQKHKINTNKKDKTSPAIDCQGDDLGLINYITNAIENKFYNLNVSEKKSFLIPKFKDIYKSENPFKLTSWL